MKNNLLKIAGIVLFSFCLSNLHAQSKSKTKSSATGGDGKAFGSGTHLLNLGVGLGTGNYYRSYRGNGYRYKSSPAYSLSYEQALPDKVGPGYLGLGVYFGYQSANATYDYYWDKHGYNNYYYYRYTWRNYMLGARLAYHLDALNFARGEVYFGLLAGLRIQNYSYENSNPDPLANDYRISSGSLYPSFSVFAGGRYFLTDNIGVFAEVGYGISYLTAGLTFKF